MPVNPAPDPISATIVYGQTDTGNNLFDDTAENLVLTNTLTGDFSTLPITLHRRNAWLRLPSGYVLASIIDLNSGSNANDTNWVQSTSRPLVYYNRSLAIGSNHRFRITIRSSS